MPCRSRALLWDACAHAFWLRQAGASRAQYSACRGWEPGDAELEEATLVVQLLAELAPARDLLRAAPQLQEAAYRLSAR